MGHEAAELTRFLIHHGYSVIFFWVLAEQAGMPVPSAPLLLTAGALSAEGKISFQVLLLLTFFGAFISDLMWFQLGRTQGGRMLSLLCRISLEPDSCVKNTENLFVKRGASSLLISKFLPGLNTVAQPMAGIVRLSWIKFLTYDICGTLLWAGAILAAGRLFHKQVEDVLASLRRTGASMLVIAIVAAAAWITFKYVQRRRFLHGLRVSRISPEELKEEIDSGKPVVVVDLRNNVSMDGDAVQIAGALRLTPEQLEERHQEIPRDTDVILYCT
ncbi:MAG TPA: VTT domain-containing protein [Terriglobales bacterium]|nr:VTT domain-containing protein [Terriglobales bacterium]